MIHETYKAIILRLSPKDYKRFLKAAKKAKLTLTEWIRRELIKAR